MKNKKPPFNFDTHCPITGFKRYSKSDEEQYLRMKPDSYEKEITKSALK